MHSETQSLGSDNHAGAHPRILSALVAANQGHAHSYGGDAWSGAAETLFKREFGAESETYFVFNGTAANVLALSALVEPHHAILCAQESHLWNDECGAPERWTGAKLMPLPSRDGKISVDALEAALIRGGDQHWSQARAISISQPTELGTVYSKDELSVIAAFAKKRNLRLHVDGARLVNAANFLGCSIADACLGADVVSFGGTKNGLVFGEAVVFRTPSLAREFKWRRKQGMQLPSKCRFIAAQFQTLLQDELWKEIAATSHSRALHLQAGLARAGVEVTRPVQSNAVFARFPKAWIALLKETSFFYVWDERTFECRLMTSFDSTLESIDAFVATVERLAQTEGSSR